MAPPDRWPGSSSLGKKDRVINTVTGKIGYLLLLTLPVIEHLHKASR